VWPPDALEFLRELEDNNDREWFKRNRGRYDEHLLAPARELADKLSDLGRPHFFRPYNNLRFRPGPPLKEHLGVAIGYGPAGGYYFDLSLDGLLIAAGLYQPAPDQLERFRAVVDDERRVRGYERGLAAARRAGLTPPEPELKRAPRGYAMDHPRIDHLRRRQLTVSCRHPLEAWLHEPTCDERVGAELRSARALVKWLAETIGPSTRPARQ
jgi:uncharacterized protein (TIGR02453 family)